MSTLSQHDTSSATLLRGAVDVHVHYLSPAYRRGLADAGITHPDGFPYIPDWDVENAVEGMDRLQIAASVLSVSSPGVFFGDIAATCGLAREVNEEGAEIVRTRPDRFGLLACLPLPDVDAALEELRYSYDELKVDGVGLLTNYGGVYLGEDGHEELFAELNRLRAVVVLHPASPPGWEALVLGRPRPMLEFPLDTTRTVFRLILEEVPERYPEIRFVIPHVGSALPALVDRVSTFMELVGAQLGQRPVDLVAALGRFHYDLSGAALPRPLPALLDLVDSSQLLYGSDAPFAPAQLVADLGRRLVGSEVLDEKARMAMLRENALRIFPRFGQAV